ncbi:RNA-directed DNA polymerase, eukaryota, reverse transcriptase zinc-binding domain protein [Tanacetum coccineum]
MGQDIVVAVTEFFSSGKFPPGCNSTFIALIPKIHDAKIIKNFLPISLIGSIYKILAKILANRLSLVILDLINEVQTAFVPNQQILDGPFILNELISWCKHKKVNAMIFKVDFEKGFDSVRCDYFDDILKSFVFGDTWRSWISSFLNSAKGSVLINESPTSEFQFHKGLKKGDPLSLFLFILVMESLHRSFSRVMEAGLFKVRWEKVLVSKNNGGLGVSSLYATNRDLLFKWIWRFLTQCSSLWSSLIKAIHGVKGNIDDSQTKISGSIWQELVRELAALKSKVVGKLVGELVVGDLVGELVVGELIVEELMVGELM